ncbi:hypothetical protein GQ651_16635 [Alphaproteobacteria bacterium GH1-50]|uniref:Uncharacterized protein n=1 Tax=Kangsaoukella pontilimi TaxID=2691042 RepID=A0A7C9MLR8_9RHOB|nr:hypothetical protein [Kangsaoukella pontilimi]MXQ09475.1 hypothetical protein [Kangsaoukella pontilimi]
MESEIILKARRRRLIALNAIQYGSFRSEVSDAAFTASQGAASMRTNSRPQTKIISFSPALAA